MVRRRVAGSRRLAAAGAILLPPRLSVGLASTCRLFSIKRDRGPSASASWRKHGSGPASHDGATRPSENAFARSRISTRHASRACVALRSMPLAGSSRSLPPDPFPNQVACKDAAPRARSARVLRPSSRNPRKSPRAGMLAQVAGGLRPPFAQMVGPGLRARYRRGDSCGARSGRTGEDPWRKEPSCPSSTSSSTSTPPAAPPS